MWSVIATVLGWVLSLITGKKTSDAERAGRAEQKSTDMQASEKAVTEEHNAQVNVSGSSDADLDRRLHEWDDPSSRP